MSELTADKLALRAFDLGLLDSRQLEQLRTDLGPLTGTAEDFRRIAARRELLTNYQVDRLIKGETTGFFYGDYKVLYLVGTGTFARVYRAENMKNHKVFALKVLRKSKRADPKDVELFLREGEVGLLLRHANIVGVHEVSTDPKAPYFAMDFVEGQNLREFVKVRKALPPLEAVRIMCDVMAGLAYAAQQGIFHRDLKLSNVLLTSRGMARIVDFGLYGMRSSDKTSSSSPSARSIDYVALERGTGVRRNDPRSDLFFAGAMLYHMLAGQSPLLETHDRLQRMNISRYREIKSLVDIDPSIPRSVCGIVTKAMQLEADRRHQNPSEMLLELQQALKRIEQGDTSGEPTNAPAPAMAAAPLPIAEQEGTSHTVMVVESNTDMQNLLREKLKKHGYRVLVLSDPQRALERFKDDQPPAECVVFCAGTLDEAALDAFNQFGDEEHTRKIPAILLIGEDQTNIARHAHVTDSRLLLQMPLKVRDVRTAIKRLLKIAD